MEINKKFWETVKKEYEEYPSYTSYYLCHSSSTFEHTWYSNEKTRKIIKKIGKKFLDEHPELRKEHQMSIGVTFTLFVSKCTLNLFVKPTRLAFLEWVINQY